MTTTTKEYQVIYQRNGRQQSLDGFPIKDINWGGYFHGINKFEVIRWEERTISTSSWVESKAE